LGTPIEEIGNDVNNGDRAMEVMFSLLLVDFSLIE